jgi:hypothetical protein
LAPIAAPKKQKNLPSFLVLPNILLGMLSIGP